MRVELPFQTFERVYNRPWPGGDSEEVAALLKFFGITYVPGTEQANLALQEKLLTLAPFQGCPYFTVERLKQELAKLPGGAWVCVHDGPVVQVIVEPNANEPFIGLLGQEDADLPTPIPSDHATPTFRGAFAERDELKKEVERLTTRVAELETKRQQLKSDCSDAHEDRRQVEAERDRLRLALTHPPTLTPHNDWEVVSAIGGPRQRCRVCGWLGLPVDL